MKHLNNLIHGFFSILRFRRAFERTYIRGRNGFERDKQNLRKDVAVVGDGLRDSLRRHSYGEQGGSSASYQ